MRNRRIISILNRKNQRLINKVKELETEVDTVNNRTVINKNDIAQNKILIIDHDARINILEVV